MLNEFERILLIRTDKIGDVLLTTPATSALRKKFPKARIVMLTSPMGAEVYRGNPDVDRIIISEELQYTGLIGFFRLWNELRKERFQAVVAYQTRVRFAFMSFLCGIRYRVGPLSQWWSWLLFNYGRRQTRSSVEMHEAHYNVQLLSLFGIQVSGTKELTKIFVQPDQKRSAQRFFQEKGIAKKFKTVAIHPGMAGSALNWPDSHYVALGRRLIKKYNVLITGGPTETVLVDQVFQGILQNQSYAPDQPAIAKYVGEKGLSELIAIIDQCDGLVAPSTGPMHIAVALGKKVITVFSPIKVQSAMRWGPFGVPFGTNLGISAQDQASILVPDVHCAEEFKCALTACIYYPCMPRIAVEDVETQISVLLDESSVSMFKSSRFEGYDLDQVVEEW